MKKDTHANIAIVLLLTAGISIFALSGCSRNTDEVKEAQSVQEIQPSSPASENASNTPDAGQNNGRKTEEMQANIQKNLSALVADGTITQEQSEKIAAAYQPAGGRGNGQVRTPNNQAGSTQNPPQNPPQSGDQGTAGQQQRSRRNPLEGLVNDGTLTQDQSDKVMEAIRQNFTRPQQ